MSTGHSVAREHPVEHEKNQGYECLNPKKNPHTCEPLSTAPKTHVPKARQLLGNRLCEQIANRPGSARNGIRKIQ